MFACLCGLILTACHAPDQALDDSQIKREAEPKSSPIEFGTSYQIASDIYGMDREINVYAPTIPEWGKGYFEDPLPVLYVIDGGTQQDFFHIAALSQLTLINAERQPMIVVGVRTHNRRAEITPKAHDPRYLGGEFAEWGGSETFRRHLIQEVIPFIKARYPGGRDVVMGESLAGLFVMETFLQDPQSFDDYVAVSPSLWWDDQYLAKQARPLLEGHTPSDKRLYITMANEGGTMRMGLETMLQAFDGHKDIVNLKFVDRAMSDSHASIYHHAARDALSWMYAMPETPYGDMPWYMTIGGHPSNSGGK